MPGGGNEEAGELGHQLDLVARRSAIDQAHHDIVLQPVVDLDVPSVNESSEIRAREDGRDVNVFD